MSKEESIRKEESKEGS